MGLSHAGDRGSASFKPRFKQFADCCGDISVSVAARVILKVFPEEFAGAKCRGVSRTAWHGVPSLRMSLGLWSQVSIHGDGSSGSE